MDYLRSDSILREILEDRKTLTGFLDAVFGFMSRNTDFYHIQHNKDDTLGFPIGVKEQILMSCMQKYEHTLVRSNLVKNIATEPDPSFVAEEIEVIAVVANENTNKNHVYNSNEILEASKTVACSTNNKNFSELEYKNGSVHDNYCWSQTLKDVELYVLLPKEVKSAKHVKVYFKSNYIKIETLLPQEEVLINAETWDKYRHNDVIWSISEGKLLASFDKLKECWWDKLFFNETSINIKSVDTERYINDYSSDVQNVLEKINSQESNPQSLWSNSLQDSNTIPLNEYEQMARLRQAWNAEGSPFKGQPFDPSVIQFN